MTEAQQVSNWNLPNALTTLRIVLVPFFGWALLVDGGESVLWRMVAFVIFVVAMITDKIDGDIARSRGLITNFGKIADPIADKAITGMAFIGLSIVGDIWWWVTIVVLAREWSVTLLRLSILKSVVMQAADLGKLKTTVQGVALGILLLPLPHGDEAHGGEFDQFGTVGEVRLLHRPGLPGGGRRAHAVVGARVLPGRLAAAGEHLGKFRRLTFGPFPESRG